MTDGTHPFAGSPLDRAADKRTDDAWLDARRNDPRTCVVTLRDGKPRIRDGRLATHHPLPPSALPHPLPLAGEGSSERSEGTGEGMSLAPNNAILLGLQNDIAYFAIETNTGEGFEELRAVALMLPPEEAAIVAVAKSLLDWHKRHGFCAICGQRTNIAMAGWKRVCPSCNAEHFPRVDPVVIMLPVRGDRCLLGRQHAWPPGRMAPLAGFMEPGETIDEACARELKEESQLIAKHITYLGSQPWPFPSSLMIGLIAEVEDGEAIADPNELEEVRWFTREEARTVLEGKHAEVSPPTRLGISYQLIVAWVEGG